MWCVVRKGERPCLLTHYALLTSRADAGGVAVEAFGVGIMVVGGLLAFIGAVPRPGRDSSYEALRRNLGRSVLLGLEVLIVADIGREAAQRTRRRTGPESCRFRSTPPARRGCACRYGIQPAMARSSSPSGSIRHARRLTVDK